MDYYSWYRKVFFHLDPEAAHAITLRLLKHLTKLHLIRSQVPNIPCQVMGINFPNPIGLAGGFDRHAEYLSALAGLGFGFIEAGTITPQPQPGNPKPRIFRVVPAQAIINRVGFYSKGIEYARAQLAKSNYRGILGINVGKNLATPIERAVDDYLAGMRSFYPFANYLTINISSPNTPGLRQLQYGSYLIEFLTKLKNEQAILADMHEKYVPIVVKIDPDLSDEELKTVCENLLTTKIDGVIATNTTISRPGIAGCKHADERGGLSGAPLFALSQQAVAKLHEHIKGHIPIIALGGIMTADQAAAMFKAGASLIQLYTGLIYQGPTLIKQIIEFIKRDNLTWNKL